MRTSMRPAQDLLPFRMRGGARPGAGRKPNGERPGVSHGQRARVTGREPVHVTAKLSRGLPRLRSKQEYAALRRAFAAGCDRRGFRLAHYAVLDDHLHLVVEAESRDALSRGLQGLLVRVAKALNRLWARRGSVFADRYHEHVLRTPLEVRRALAYVPGNARHHVAGGHVVANALRPIDPYSSGLWFDGWQVAVAVTVRGAPASPVTRARTWLLTIGWRRHGLLAPA
jgi:REP element-mobilizing transposase RayT